MTHCILLADNDHQSRIKIEEALKPLDCEVEVVCTIEEGLLKIAEVAPVLILLDVTIFDGEGWQACQRIRLVTGVWLVIISKLGDDNEIKYLEMGADVCLIKPISSKVLQARVKAMFRRDRLTTGQPNTNFSLRHQGLIVDDDRYLVTYQDRRIDLTRTEYNLLRCLLKHKHQPLSFEFLLVQVLGIKYKKETGRLRSHIKNLRRKLTKSGFPSDLIHSNLGEGYQFD